MEIKEIIEHLEGHYQPENSEDEVKNSLQKMYNMGIRHAIESLKLFAR